jgi:hypothetical protein
LEASLVDFVGDVLRFAVGLVGSGVATFRNGVPKDALTDVDVFGVPSAGRRVFVFGGETLPFEECLLRPGVATFREGVPNVGLAGVDCFGRSSTAGFGEAFVSPPGSFPGVTSFLFGDLGASFDIVSSFTPDAIFFVGLGVLTLSVPPPAIPVFFGVTLFIGNSQLK